MFGWLQSLSPPQNVSEPLLTAYVLFDIFLIIVLARLLGNLMTKIGQPRVIGEILAGVLLGPTLFGQNLSLVIVPAQARPTLNSLATLALGLFMFLAGLEYDFGKARGRGRQAGVLAVCATAIPALLGFPIAQAIYAPGYAGEAVTEILPFALFIGAALSVTAFPVMANILMERGELNTQMGSLAVAATGIMSVIMFSYLSFAAAVTAARGFSDLLVRLGLLVIFVLGSWFVVRPLLPRLLGEDKVSGDGMAICLAGLTLYAMIAHQLGINAMMGGFLWGMILPASLPLRASISARIKDMAMIFFLPIFSAMAGFQTDLKLITLEALPAVGLMLLGAIGGKFLAAVPSRAFGISWSEAGILAALFNTRGLLVLVAGLIGLQLQIITNLTFTIFMIVALATNLMTVPLLNLIAARQQGMVTSQGVPGTAD
jgi:Kef-type K+ transport system membrane component KefB